jgi:hypothetical protein
MPYIGNAAGNRFVASKAASVYSGNGSTTAFTLEHAVGSDEDILVSVDGVIQEPSVAYAVSSGTTLTFTAAPSSNSGNNIFVYYLFRTVGTVDHPSTSALSATSGTFTGNTTIGGTLGVTGTSTLSGNATIGTDSGDTRFALNSANQYTMVLKNAGNISGQIGGGGADVLRFSNAAGATIMEMNAGQITMPLQPSFSVRPSSNQTNISVGSPVDVVFAQEIFDVGSNFASNTFTAPVTGKYQLNVRLYLNSIDTAAAYYILNIVTSNFSYVTILNPKFTADVAFYTMNASVLADMDANDTAKIRIHQDSGTAQTDITAADSGFNGILVG